MATKTYTIPDEKVSLILDAFESAYPIPSGTDNKPKFTKLQWFDECIKSFIKTTVEHYRFLETQKIAMQSIDDKEVLIL